MKRFPMSKKEIDQVAIFERLKNKEIKQKHAAKLLGLGIRQIKRKAKAYRQKGAQSLIHQLRGGPGNHKLSDKLKNQAIGLVEEKYPDFGPTLAAEKLEEIDRLTIHQATLRNWMIEEGLWKPKKRKARHREWRQRKECLGELVQFDGSEHDWFEDRASKCSLLSFIDDAGSQVLYGEFAQSESTKSVMKATKAYLRAHGRPVEIYADQGKVVKVNQNNPDDKFKTQYRRALDELGIGVSFALSPQAKGRIERLFGTLQDRLVKEMRLRNISSIKEANQFLKEYLPQHNNKFAVEPRDKTNLHRPIKGYNLDQIFCIKHTRILKEDFTIRYSNQWYQLAKKQSTLIFPKNSITVSEYLDGKIRLSIRKVKLHFTRITKQPEPKLRLQVKTQRKPWKPPANHPWRKYPAVVKR